MNNKLISIGYGRHLFVADNPERKRMELCAAETAGFHMIIFTKKSDGLKETIGRQGLVLNPTNSSSRFMMPLNAFLIAQKIIRRSPQACIVTTQDPFEPGLIGWLLKVFFKVKLVVQEHGDVFSSLYWREESFLNKVRYAVGLWVLRRADVVRVVSERTMQNLRNRGLKDVRKLPVSIDIKACLEATSDHTLVEMFGRDTFVFLTVARFVKQKNFPLMIKAFAAAYKQNQNLRLLIVGSGPQAELINELIEKNFPKKENAICPIKVLPWSNDVPNLMKQAQAYVLSSNYEGWGRVLVEAVACQLPIVTTDVGCVGEVVIDGVHGLVVPVGDESRLTTAMLHMATPTTHLQIKQQLTKQSVTNIPGVELDNYGKQWMQTLLSPQ